MPDREKTLDWATLGGGALIALWYLLLLYRFPYSLPYRGEEIFIAIFGLLYVVLFAAIVCAFAIFAIKLLKSRVQTESLEESDSAVAVKAHYLSHLRKLILFSLLVAWLHILRSVEGDAAMFLLVATVPAFVLSSALANLVVARTGGLDARKWSPEGWLSALVVLGTAGSLVGNAWDLAKTTWEMIKFVFLAATGSLEEARLILGSNVETALLVLIFWLLVLYYLIVLYHKWRSLIADCKIMFRKLAALYEKLAQRLRGGSSAPSESPPP